MGKSIKKPTPSKKLTETQLIFDKLQTEISTVLAPRLIGVMSDFGYDSIYIVSDGTNTTVTLKEIAEIAAPENKYWKQWKNSDANIFHRDTLATFRRLKNTTEALMKERSQAEIGIEWINKIGNVEKRKVIIEKFKTPVNGKK